MKEIEAPLFLTLTLPSVEGRERPLHSSFSLSFPWCEGGKRRKWGKRYYRDYRRSMIGQIRSAEGVSDPWLAQKWTLLLVVVLLFEVSFRVESARLMYVCVSDQREPWERSGGRGDRVGDVGWREGSVFCWLLKITLGLVWKSHHSRPHKLIWFPSVKSNGKLVQIFGLFMKQVKYT